MISFEKKHWHYLSRVTRIAELIAIIAGVCFAMINIRDVRNMQSAQLMLEFNKELNSDVNSSIITAIENGEPIFKHNGGKFTETEIDSYLGTYELLNTVWQADLISNNMLYSAFEYSIIKTNDNQEITEYVERWQQIDPFIYYGFQGLAESFKLAK